MPVKVLLYSNESTKVQSLGPIVNLQTTVIAPEYGETEMTNDHPVSSEIALTLWLQKTAFTS